jgi:signal transduction histidine kinase
MKSAGFEGKLLEKLDKLAPRQIQQILGQVIEQKQFLLTILDALNEGVIVTNDRLTLHFINPKARSMLGLPRRRTLIGEDLKALLPIENPLAEVIGSLRGNLREIKGYEAPYTGQKDRYVELTTLRLRARGGEGLRGGAPAASAGGDAEEDLLILLLQDVTERRLRQSEQARAQRLASMATLTSGIAHEIKNPLNSLTIHAQLLQGEVERAKSSGSPLDAARAERASGVILEELDRLGRIVEDFLQAARPRRPELAECDLADYLTRAGQIFGAECEAQGVTFLLRLDPDLPSTMLDRHLFMQALRNLLGNALDALREWTPEARRLDGGFQPRIELSAELAGDNVNVTLADNGPGIPSDTLQHIFEPYFTTKFHGTGLGLMVVYRIVTEHGGLLHVDTQPGEGTRFSLALPLHHKPVRLLQDAGASSERVEE